MKSSRSGNPLPPADWLLAETFRRAEERSGRPLGVPASLEAGKQAGGSLGKRIVARAVSLPDAEEVRNDIQRLAGITRFVRVALVIAGLASGVAAAGISVGDGRQVDILLAMVTLLGLPTIMLAVWLVMLVFSWRRRTNSPIIGQVVLSVTGWLAGRLLKSPLKHDLVAASGSLLGRGALARWSLSCLTHLFWAAYSAAALVTLAMLFAVLQYDLAWGTTLLTDAAVIQLIAALGHLPAQVLGVSVPDAELILSSREGVETGAGRAVWARFLLAVVLVYGFVPRILLGAGSLLLFRRVRRALRLDLDQAGYLRLAPELMPSGRALRPEKPRTETPPPELPDPARRRPKSGPTGTPILVGVELERPEEQWPPVLPGIEARVLGRADDRDQLKSLCAALDHLERPPCCLIALCALGRTPDRGTERALDALAEAAGAPLVLIIDEAGRFAERGGDVPARFAQWRKLAERLGARAVLLELDAPEAAAVAELHRVTDTGSPAE